MLEFEFRSCWLKQKSKIEISIVLGSGSESVIFEHATGASPENFLETQFLGPNSDLLKLKPRNLCFWKYSKKFWCTLTFKNHSCLLWGYGKNEPLYTDDREINWYSPYGKQYRELSKIKNICSSSVKNTVGSLIGIALNL